MPSYKPRRWTQDAVRPQDPSEVEAGRLMREARALQGPSALALARIRQRVEARADRNRQIWFAGRRWSTKSVVIALVGTAALASVGAVVGVVAVRATPSNRSAPVPPPAPHPLPAPTTAVVPEKTGELTVEERPLIAVGLEPEGEKHSTVRRRPHGELARVSAPRLLGAPVSSVESEPVANDLAVESALLAQALLQQNHEHDPAAALATLEEHRRRFPRGALADEARAAQLHALMALGRQSEALELIEALQATAPATLARQTELSLLQAEVLTQLGRCDDALPLFDVLVSRSPSGGLYERALYGRALCRSKRGDVGGSRGDFERYLLLFPTGRFAVPVRAELQK